MIGLIWTSVNRFVNRFGDKFMKCAVVPSWLGLTKSWSTPTLIDMADTVAKSGVDPSDLSAVKKVCEEANVEIIAKAKKIRKTLKTVEQQRKALLDELKGLNPLLPVENWAKIKEGRI
jgi:hypothetical protein